MNFDLFLTESIGFTRATLVTKWSRWLTFVLLGLPFVALGLLVNFLKIIDGTAIRWEIVPWPVVIPLIIAGFALSFFTSGYIVRLLRGGEVPPEFDRWPALALDGIRLEVIVGIWAFPILFLVALELSTTAGGLTSPSFESLLLLPFLIMLDLAVVIAVLLYGIPGIIRFTRTGRIRDAFAIGAIGSDIGRIGWGNYLVALVVLLVIGFAYSVVTSLLSFIPAIGTLLPFVLEPFITVFRCRFIAHVYDSAGEGAAMGPVAMVERAGVPEAAVSGKALLTWALILIVILAACSIPVYPLISATSSLMPSMTLEELNQAKNDDISIYSEDGYFASPQFTRDGSHIFYTATTRPAVKPAGREYGSSDWENDIWIMDGSGGNQTRVTHLNDINRFTLDPGSDWVAFDRYANGSNSIYIMQAASKPARIPGPLPFMYFSSWSPDGTQIAATGFNLSDYNGYSYSGSPENKVPSSGTEWSRLFIMNADGTSPREIARAGTGQYELGTESSWSPDGKMLAVPVFIPGKSGLAVIDTGTGSVHAITLNPDQTSEKFMRRDDAYPRWSPQGDLIAFIRNGDVWVIRPDGSGLQEISSDGTVDHLAWSPDGSRLAFSAENYLGIMDPDGKNLHRIANISPGPLSWSPDGKVLTYSPGNGSRIRIMSLTPGVMKMGELAAQQMDLFSRAGK